MNLNGQMMPYDNDEVFVYMDDMTNVALQPLRLQNSGKSLSDRRGNVGNSRVPNNAASLLEKDNNPGRNPPPSYGPEIDDLDPSAKCPNAGSDDRGIDDGFLPPSHFPMRPHQPGRFPFDVNIYQQKKTLAQGMMDLALISANANQFRYVLQSKGHPYYTASLAMIGTSLFLQIVVGIGLIWNSTYNVKKDTQVLKANKANNLTVIGIFLVTILNVFISSFGVAEPSANGLLKNDEDTVPDVESLTND